jgi:hypothetical protein
MRARLAVLAAGIRRFLVILAVIAGATLGVSLLFTALGGWSADRAVSVGFDLVGVFFLVGGFFLGNRGPARVKGAAGAVPLFGERTVRWATTSERDAALSDSAVFIAVGVALIVIGIVVDSRYRLF